MNAIEKIQEELKNEIVSTQQRLAEYLSEAVMEDTELAEKVLQESKNLKGCQQYVHDKARKAASGQGGIMIDDATVFNWAREYYFVEDSKKEDKPKEDKKPAPARKASKKAETKEDVKPNPGAEETPEEGDDDDDFLL